MKTEETKISVSLRASLSPKAVILGAHIIYLDICRNYGLLSFEIMQLQTK